MLFSVLGSKRGTPFRIHSQASSSLLVAGISTLCLSGAVQAQEGDEEAAASGGFTLEEVVVTARRREESMQEVPVAVSAFDGDSLRSLGVTNMKDLDGIVPGLNMGGGGNGVKGDSNPYIRGVGQRETRVTIDPAVDTYLDPRKISWQVLCRHNSSINYLIFQS